MCEELQHNSINFNDYNPIDWKDVVMLIGKGIPVPKHEDMIQGQSSVWHTIMNINGTIVSNLKHRDYPDTYCQVQISFDDNSQAHVFMQHHGPLEKHIPEELVDTIFINDMFPQIMSKLNEKTD